MIASRLVASLLGVTTMGVLGAACSPTGADGSQPLASSPPVVLAAISRTSSDPGDVAAMDACWITDSQHKVISTIPFEKVSGAGKVTPARAAPSYVPLFGTEPEIQTDAPAWIFAFSGEIILVTVRARDPTCVFVNGLPVWYGTGASLIDGTWIESSPPPTLPSATLPPLAP